MSAFSAAAQDEDGDIISALRACVADLEAQLYAVGAGGVGKLEQPQSVTYCHQSQPKGEQEPVAWQYRMRPDWGSKKDCWGPWQDCTKEQAAMYQRVPLLHDWAYESRQLYTHPQPHRQPLTEERIMDLVRDGCEDMRWPSTALTIFRTAERAHGIGGEA